MNPSSRCWSSQSQYSRRVPSSVLRSVFAYLSRCLNGLAREGGQRLVEPRLNGFPLLVELFRRRFRPLPRAAGPFGLDQMFDGPMVKIAALPGISSRRSGSSEYLRAGTGLAAGRITMTVVGSSDSSLF